MMEKQLISVIVPIYKVEEFLDRCVESIVNQTYRNLEIILVDDGSPDRCPEICDRWEKSDGRIRVIHKKNGGLSDARNAGLKAARGSYIGFVDSDDWIHIQMYEKLHHAMCTEHADLVSCEFKKIKAADKKEVQRNKKDGTIQCYKTQEALKALILEQGLKQVVWNKLYKKELLESIAFPYGKYNEDEFWTYQIVAKARKIVTLSYAGYFYFQRSDSIIGETYSIKRLDVLEGKEGRQEFVDRFFPELSSAARLNLFYSYCYAYQCCLRCMQEGEMRTADERIRSGLKRFPLQKKDYEQETEKQKIWIFLYRISLRGTCKLRNRLKIGR